MSKVFESSPLVPEDVLEAYRAEQEAASIEVDLGGGPSGLQASMQADADVARFAVGQVSALFELPKTGLEEVVASSRQGAFAPGDALYLEGEPAASFFVVLEGTVALSRGKEAVTELTRGHGAGLLDLLSCGRRVTTARAVDEVVVLEVPREALDPVFQRDPEVLARVLSHLAESLTERFFSCALFDGIPVEAMSSVRALFRAGALGPGQDLVRPGEVTSQFLLTLSGTLEADFRGQAGQGHAPEVLEPGLMVAITSGLSGLPVRMRLHAPQGASFLIADHRGFLSLVRDHPVLRLLPSRLPLFARAVCPDLWVSHLGWF